MNILENLKDRGAIHDLSHPAELEKELSQGSLALYCGFDPTADSLHVGSMIPLLIMRRLQELGHKPIALVGSATGRIGDPSGRSEERKLLDEDVLRHNVLGIEKQIGLFLSSSGPNAFTLVRNDQWLGGISYLDFLRDVGKHFTVNHMLAKDSVRSRMEDREQGISYTEFSYMLLQAYDFYHLYKTHNCRLQVGGSDQWGNITAGLDFIRRKLGPENQTPQKQAFGLTFPLLTTSTGGKFGKSEKGTIWLDAKKTSPYQFFQYWLNTSDEDVLRFIKLFTVAEKEQLSSLAEAVSERAESREAQYFLASTLCELIHGEAEARRALEASKVLFGGDLKTLSAETLLEVFADVPSIDIPASSLEQGLNICELLVQSKLAPSKGAAHRSVESGGIYLNNERLNDPKQKVTLSAALDERALLLRSGKKSYCLIKVSPG